MDTDLSESKNPRYLLGITDEPNQLLQPISGYALEPLLSLEDACQPILSIVPHLPAHIWIAKQNAKNPSDGLTQDESAAIHLYTMEWDANVYETRESLYSHLNRTLKQTDRAKLRPWFRYLKLFLTAIVKLPPVPRQTVWRGIRQNLTDDYPKDSKTTWWGFSSCTKSLDVLQSDLYLGNTGTRTLFSIETFNARTIRAHSYFKAEDEILLLPGTYLEVISQLKSSSDLNIIHLRQIRPPHQLLEPPFDGAELLPSLDFDSDTKKQLHSFRIEESNSQYKSWLKNKKVRISLGFASIIIIIAIILGAVLGTQLRKTKSSNNVLYWAYGPQVDLDPKLLVGWTECYSGTYDKQLYGAELNRILTQCNKTNLLMACSSVNESNFAVAAMGNRFDVTYQSTYLGDIRPANGISWYFGTNSSWGFAKVGDPLNLSPCDSIFDQDADLRLCWHTLVGLDGFRCGQAYFNLSGNYFPNQWYRIVYHAD